MPTVLNIDHIVFFMLGIKMSHNIFILKEMLRLQNSGLTLLDYKIVVALAEKKLIKCKNYPRTPNIFKGELE